jgi:hypothetical protein
LNLFRILQLLFEGFFLKGKGIRLKFPETILG